MMSVCTNSGKESPSRTLGVSMKSSAARWPEKLFVIALQSTMKSFHPWSST